MCKILQPVFRQRTNYTQDDRRPWGRSCIIWALLSKLTPTPSPFLTSLGHCEEVWMEEMIPVLQHSQRLWSNTREATQRSLGGWFGSVLQTLKKCKPTFETRPLFLSYRHHHEQKHNLKLEILPARRTKGT